MKNSILLLLILSAFSFLIEEEELMQKPKNFPKPTYNFKKNPLKKETIELGRTLFYDPILSRNNTIACSNCHLQYTAFTHVDHALSHGIEDKIGIRNSPALMNLAWQNTFMWDGAINHLDMQSLAPISNPLEMDEKIENVVAKLQKDSKYRKLFYAAYQDSIVTGEHLLKSISQFMLTLVSANSKYDKMKRKELEFTDQEKNGYKLFKKHCNNCHTEPLFTNFQFENNGIGMDTSLKDYGRLRITLNPSDSIKFKVPTLRNIEFSSPYMHDGRFKRLNEVLKHYTSGIKSSKTLANKLKQPINLTPNEKVDLITFLLTLSDKEFLFNPKFGYPK